MSQHPRIPAQVFAHRRNELGRRLYDRVGQCLVLIGSNPAQVRSNDTFFPYRQNSNLLYLSGFAEADAVLVLEVMKTGTAASLFITPSSLERLRWDGPVASIADAREISGIEDVATLDRLEDALGQKQPAALLFDVPDPAKHKAFAGIFGSANPPAQPMQNSELEQEITAMRLIKDEHEIAALKYAADISSAAHKRAMQATRPGIYEYQLQAEIEYEFTRNQAQPGYASIVAAGANANVLHWIKNDCRIGTGDMVLIDAGCEIHGYSADITRTWPAVAFSPEQRALYQQVLKVNEAVIQAAQPGRTFGSLQETAARLLTESLVELELLSGSTDRLIETEAYRRFYMHGVSHWLGLDVHDAGGKLKPDGEQHLLAPGQVLTVEPGLYIDDGEDIPPALRNQAVRIEDDIVITDSGCQVLTGGITKDPAEIDRLVGSAASS